MIKNVISTAKGNKGQKKFKLSKGAKKDEKDIDIDITSGTESDIFVLQKLDTDTLDKKLDAKFGGDDIVWFNNFAIKKNTADGDPINQSYSVTIPGLSSYKKIVIQDGNANNGRAYVYSGPVVNDTIELTDGDPAVGGAPPMG